MYLSTEADISEPMDPVMELHPIEHIMCATMKGVCTFVSCEWDFGRSTMYLHRTEYVCMDQGMQGKCITNKATPTRTTPFSKEKELT